MEARGDTDRQIVRYAWRKERKRIEQSSSLCPSGELELNNFYQVKRMLGGIGRNFGKLSCVVCSHTTTTRHNTTQQHDHNTTRRQRETETEADREREKEDRDRERREDGRGETREEKTKENKTRQDRRRQDKTRMQREERR